MILINQEIYQYPLLVNLFLLLAIFFILVIYRLIYNTWFEDLEHPKDYSLQKAPSTYDRPSRSESKTFNDFLRMARMTTSYRETIFAKKLSQLIKEHLELRNISNNHNLSDNLRFFLNTPINWLKNKKNAIQSTKLSLYQRFELLYEEYIQILQEVEHLTDVSLLITPHTDDKQ